MGATSAGQAAGPDDDGILLFMLWNMRLCARSLLNLTMIWCTACIHKHKRSDYRTTKTYTGAFLVLQVLISDTITIGKQQREVESVPGLRAHSMIWPLAFILSSGYLGEVEKSFVKDQ